MNPSRCKKPSVTPFPTSTHSHTHTHTHTHTRVPSKLPVEVWEAAAGHNAVLVGTAGDAHYWAVEATTSDPHVTKPVENNSSNNLDLTDGSGRWASARALVGIGAHQGTSISKFDAAVAGRAVALLNWHRDTQFSGSTGEPTVHVAGASWRESG